MHPRRREGSQEVQEPEELIGGRTYLAVRAQLQFSKSSRGRKLWRGQRRKNEGKSLKKFKRLETLEGATKEKRREESQKVQEPDKADTSETLRAGSSDPDLFLRSGGRSLTPRIATLKTFRPLALLDASQRRRGRTSRQTPRSIAAFGPQRAGNERKRRGEHEKESMRRLRQPFPVFFESPIWARGPGGPPGGREKTPKTGISGFFRICPHPSLTPTPYGRFKQCRAKK